MKVKQKTLIVIDANSLIHRAYHALPSLTTPKGELVNAVYGFLLIFFKILQEFEPTYIAAAFDMPGPTEREKKYKEYKAKREKAPDELYAQIPKVQEALEALGVAWFGKQGFEADDCIGTIVKHAQRKQVQPPLRVIIVTGDQDAFQLISKQVFVYTMKKGIRDTILYNEDALKEKFNGLTPSQVIDYKALRGDPSDNIPGVTGIGEKTAIELLNEFKSLDNLYKLLEKGKLEDKVKPRIAKLLTDYKEQAEISKELATIEQDVPLEIQLSNLEWKEDQQKRQNMLRDFGFRSLAERLRKEEEKPLKKEAKKVSQASLAGLEEKKTKETALDKVEQLYEEKVFSKQVYELEKSLIPVLRQMEKEGIKIDLPYFLKLQKEMEKETAAIQKQIFKMAGKEFNVNSTQQLSEALFVDLEIPTKGLKKTPKKVVSTASSELEKLQNEYPIAKEVLKYREIQKLLTTYARPLPQLADDKSRVHTHFDQLGAATGRISSTEPNVQNIPNQGDWGNRIRKGFIAEKGFSLVSCDYSQIELRIAAHLSGDKNLQKFFKEDLDIHTMTAATVFGVDQEKVTPEMRFRAKALNFGVLYGMGAQGFAKSSGIPFEEARAFIDQYFARFPALYEYMEETKDFAKQNGYAETMFGRKRYLPDMHSTLPYLQAAAERMAQNHPIQGSMADLMKMAMVDVAKELPSFKNDVRMLLQIHDELLFEIADGTVEKTAQHIQKIMESVHPLDVPLQVDVKQGKNWGDVGKILVASSLPPRME